MIALEADDIGIVPNETPKLVHVVGGPSIKIMVGPQIQRVRVIHGIEKAEGRGGLGAAGLIEGFVCLLGHIFDDCSG